jgi:hypothetical protein
MIREYNIGMGGVDLLDALVACYRYTEHTVHIEHIPVQYTYFFLFFLSFFLFILQPRPRSDKWVVFIRFLGRNFSYNSYEYQRIKLTRLYTHDGARKKI